MSTAFLFPGQGSQTVGMGSRLNFPEELAQANEILGYSISDLCLQDSKDRLGQTQLRNLLFIWSVICTPSP